jgi:serine phosphatase RsbU (regulator of sigma subunit)/anti-sigma regulatory factor (Ser/Thr protein kinase)
MMSEARQLEITQYEEVGAARRATREVMTALSQECVAAAELVASELVTNGLLHGGGCAVFQARAIDTGVRIEVSDHNHNAPLVAVASPDAMTGRGLHLVARFAARWGVQPLPSGKMIWVEIDDHPTSAAEMTQDELLARWDDDAFEADEEAPRVRVDLGTVPTELLVAAKRHVDNLVREFTLASGGGHAGTTAPVPAPLAELIDRVVNGFEEARLEMKTQATAAARRGAAHAELVLDLPPDAADAAEAYLAAMDEVDGYCRANRLLTLETPPQHRVFRRWYIGQLVLQLRAAAAGQDPPTLVRFEHRLLEEVDAAEVARRAAERAARLYTVAVALAAAASAEEVAAAVLQEGVAALRAAGGGVLLTAGAGRIFLAGAVGYAEQVVQRLRDEDADADLPAAYALRTGETVWLETPQERDERFPALAGFEPETTAICAVPLEVPGHRLGAIRFSFTQRQLFDDDERRFVLALAAEAAEALERAHILDREREARLQLEHEHESLTMLAAFGEAMLRGRDLDTVLQLATDAATQVTGADVGAFFYNTVDETGESLLLYTLSGAPREAFADFGMPRNTAIFGPTFEGLANVRLDDVTKDPRYGMSAPHHGMPKGHFPLRSYLAVPVTLSDGEVVGGLFFGHVQPAQFDETAERMAVGVAGHTAAAIENVRSLEERERVATLLQQSLLPVDLPSIAGVEMGAAYVAADSGVGGDFYDIFPLGPARWGITIGDVRGRGPRAAALTALTRYTMRTAARFGRTPPGVLAALNEALLDEGDIEQFCTAIFAVLDLSGPKATLAVANGGHPAPAIVRADGVEFHEPAAGLIGVMPDAGFVETFHTLEQGDAVVLYTDGVSEARRGGEQFGDRRLAEFLRSRGRVSPEELARILVDEARSFASGSSDDAAVFVVRVGAGTAA